MNREDCIQTFKRYGYTESQVVNIIVQVLGATKDTMIELEGQSMKAYVDTGLNIVYKNGKRFPKLEEAIKAFAAM
jgi:hypothetical protein